MQLAKHVHHGFAVLRVEVPRGLVGKKNRRIARERACHRNALLLPTRELRREVAEPMCHADAFERLHHGLAACVAREALAIGQRQLDVLIDIEIADEIERLEDEADFTVSNRGSLIGADGRDRPAAQVVLPCRRCVE